MPCAQHQENICKSGQVKLEFLLLSLIRQGLEKDLERNIVYI